MKRHILLYIYLTLSLIFQSCKNENSKASDNTIKDTIRANNFFNKYSVIQQQEDLKILKESLEKIHPGLYWHITSQDFKKTYDSLFLGIKSEKNAYQFLNDIFILTAKIRCSHTMANLSAKDKEFKLHSLPHFPFDITIEDNKLYIKDSYIDGYTFKSGSEILSINKVKARDLIQKLSEKCYADGFNPSGQYFYLSSKFDILTEYFFDIPDTYSFEIISQDKKRINATVKSINYSAIEKYQLKKYPAQTEQAIKLIDSLKTAVVTFNTFEDTSYIKFLKESFAFIKNKKVENLIIDLRKNRGGFDDFGQRLFSYLALSSFNYYDHLEMRINDLNDPIFKYGVFMDSSAVKEFFDGNHTNKMENGNYIVNKKNHSVTANAPFLPDKNGFKGKVYILISGETNSGASEFASIASYHKRATFIGQETAGGYCGNTSGFNYVLSLPNSKIRIVIPTIRYLTAIGDCIDTGGIKPNYEIKPNISGVNQDIDLEMKTAIDLIKHSNDYYSKK